MIKSSILEEKINELRSLINAELNTTPYVVDYLIAKLLDDMMHSYVSNYAKQIEYWKEVIAIIKEQIAEGNIENEP